MNSSKLSTRFGAAKKQLGQGMTEYIIIVALVAIGAIGVYSAFGHTVQGQMAQITGGLAGDTTKATAGQTVVTNESQTAVTDAQATLGLDNYSAHVGAQ